MKKLMRIGALLVFWVSTFVLVVGLLRWKQRLVLLENEQTAEAGAAAGEQTAGETDPTSNEARRALQQGRALFEVPQPYSHAELSDLLSELRRQREQFRQRQVSLDERERQLTIREEELNLTQSDLLRRARELAAQAQPASGAAARTAAKESYDADGISQLAELFEEMKESPATVSEALISMDAEKAALILLEMDKKKSADVMAHFPHDYLMKITEIWTRSKVDPGDG